MSLINQMLKDLESRRSPELPAVEVIAGQHPARKAVQQPLTTGLMILVVLLLIALVYTLWPRPETEPAREVATTPTARAVSTQNTAPAPPSHTATPAAIPNTAATTLPTPVAATIPAPHAHVSAQQAEPPQDAPQRDVSQTPRASTPSVQKRAAPSQTSQKRLYSPPQNLNMDKRVLPVSDAELARRRYQQGYHALQQRNTTEAEQHWLATLNDYPKQLETRQGLVALYLSQGRKIEAAKLLSEGVTHHPNNPQLSLLHARLLAEQGHPMQALSALQPFVGEAATSPELLALAAALQQQQRDYRQSIRHYRQALKLQPQQAHWWMGLGISLEGLGKPSEAQQAYEHALRGKLNRASLDYVTQRLQALR